MSEEEIVKVIDSVVRDEAYKFKFGYFDVEDMQQQGRLYCLEVLDKYDGIHPLYNFLRTHVHNRLFNLKRDKFSRLNKPCDICRCKQYNALDADGCSKYVDKESCKSYKRWVQRNNLKRNLMQPIDIHQLDKDDTLGLYHEINTGEDMDYHDFLSAIEAKIPPNMRGLFLRLKYHSALTKTQKLRLQKIVQEVLDERK
jgi:hypothetical protein